jgi:predicted nucleic acid-binding protein
VTAFADTSAIVKRYVPERYHEEVERLSLPLVLGPVTRVEVGSALWRKHRLGEIASNDAALLMAAFEADSEEGLYVVVALGREVSDAATAVVERHGLRAYDAVQLAAALVARDALDDLDTFAAFDTDLRAAATAEGFAVVPALIDR